MSWSYVGSVATVVVSGAATATVSLPSGVQGGDLVVAAFCMTGSGATATVSVPGFTTDLSGRPRISPTGSFSHNMWVGYHSAGGSAGSATTDTTYTATFNETCWGELVTYVLRCTSGTWSHVGSAEWNSASTYQASCPDPSYTPSASNATIWGYAGMNSAEGTTATTFSGTGPTALSNFVQNGSTANGGGVGMGWLTSSSAPGGATANQAVDPTDFACEFSETGGAAAPGAPQPLVVPSLAAIQAASW